MKEIESVRGFIGEGESIKVEENVIESEVLELEVNDLEIEVDNYGIEIEVSGLKIRGLDIIIDEKEVVDLVSV